jgi:hypothetical protein
LLNQAVTLGARLIVARTIGCSSGALGFSESKDKVSGALPWNGQLLLVNDLVSPHNFFNHSFCFSVVHGVYFVNPVLIALFETLVLFLELLISLGELLVDLGVLVVFTLEIFLVLFKCRLLCPHHVSQLALTLLQILLVVSVRLFPLVENFLVEVQLLFVESEYSLHVFHALLKDLHLLFQLDFLFSLVVGVLTAHCLEFFSLIRFLRVACLLKELFGLLMNFEQLLNLIFVS